MPICTQIRTTLLILLAIVSSSSLWGLVVLSHLNRREFSSVVNATEYKKLSVTSSEKGPRRTNSIGSPNLGFVVFHGRRKEYKYFEDYVQSLIGSLRVIGYHAEIKVYDQEIWDQHGVQSSISGVHLFLQSIPKRRLPEGSISVILNTEQMTRAKFRKIIGDSIVSDPTLILADYSLENSALLGEYTSSTRVVVLPYQVNTAEISNWPSPTRSVAFTGTNTPYRQKIHSTVGVKVSMIRGWGMQRDSALFDHKILLNVEADEDYQVFEELRCFRAIVNKQIVVTTSRINLNNHPLRKYFVACCAKDLENTISAILANHSAVRHQLFDGFDLDAIRLTRQNELASAFARIIGSKQSVNSTTSAHSRSMTKEPSC